MHARGGVLKSSHGEVDQFPGVLLPCLLPSPLKHCLVGQRSDEERFWARTAVAEFDFDRADDGRVDVRDGIARGGPAEMPAEVVPDLLNIFGVVLEERHRPLPHIDGFGFLERSADRLEFRLALEKADRFSEFTSGGDRAAKEVRLPVPSVDHVEARKILLARGVQLDPEILE